jgi:hypothetical protein
MQRRRHPLLVPLLCALALVYVLARFGPVFWIHRTSRATATETHRQQRIATTSAAPLAATSDDPPRTDHEPQSFNHRLRCTQYRTSFGHHISPEVLLLLCDRKPLEALKILAPMAEAGDERATTALLLILGNLGSSCDALKPSATFEQSRQARLRRARENGATSQTYQRLDDLLVEEQQGPTADEL